MKNPLFSLLIVLALIACQGENTNKKSTDSDKTEKANKENEVEKKVKIPSGGSADIDVSDIKTLKQTELIPFLKKYGVQNPQTIVEIKTRFGTMKAQLFAAEKLHRANFIRLAKLGYFDETFFHRVAKGYVIQAGNSDRPSTQKFRKAIGKYELPNEYHSIHQHNYGALSMAKRSDKNQSNASSPFEFFIVTDPNGAHHLDKDFTVFGRILEGMDVAKEIEQVEVDESEWPYDNIHVDVNVIK